MYTIEQLKKNKKIAVFLKTEEEYNRLELLEFNLCRFNRPAYYGISEYTWSSSSKVYTDESFIIINYSDISFEEQYEIY